MIGLKGRIAARIQLASTCPLTAFSSSPSNSLAPEPLEARIRSERRSAFELSRTAHLAVGIRTFQDVWASGFHMTERHKSEQMTPFGLGRLRAFSTRKIRSPAGPQAACPVAGDFNI